MLHPVSLPEIRNPAVMATALFHSHSLSACVATLFELPTPPRLWEEDGTNWFTKLDEWAHSQQMQVINFTDNFIVRGFYLRLFAVPGTVTRWADGSEGHKIEAALYQGEALVYNPSELEISAESLLNLKLIFRSYDPAPQRISYQQ